MLQLRTNGIRLLASASALAFILTVAPVDVQYTIEDGITIDLQKAEAKKGGKDDGGKSDRDHGGKGKDGKGKDKGKDKGKGKGKGKDDRGRDRDRDDRSKDSSLDDDGTPDRGRGDAPGTGTPGDDDGTPDQGRGDR